jgi:molybdenum-dependent DNA-binding transcriptional regulator ModE
VQSITNNTNVVASASALDRNRGGIEGNTALLSVRMDALVHNYVYIERRHANSVGIGSNALNRTITN